MSRLYVGISGYNYPGWRGDFYPAGLAARHWLTYASSHFNSIELNGTFYSLKSPDVFRRWAAETPPAHVFAIKGSRFITHNLKLALPRAATALANFYASGILALGKKTGPFLWQLPATYRFDAARMRDFLDLLPRSAADAECLARNHDDRVRRGTLLQSPVRLRYRHAFEVRHPSFFTTEFYDMLEASGCALVIADSAGKFPMGEALTAPFVYVRLHGSTKLYASGYTPKELDDWARRIELWRDAGRDVYVYFDNDALGHAPRDAQALGVRLRLNSVGPRRARAGAARTRGSRRAGNTGAPAAYRSEP